MLILTAVITLLKVCCSAHAQNFNPLVRVHLAKFYTGCGSLLLSPSSTYKIALIDPNGKSSTPLSQSIPRAFLIEAVPRRDQSIATLQSGLVELTMGESMRLEPNGLDSDSVVAIQRDSSAKAHRYRGTILVTCEAGCKLRAFDSLPLEDYLKGVVGPELGENSPLEALKAQAVAARTYTVKNFGKCWADGGAADLDDTTRCQNYLGYDAENWRCRQAVTLTASEILTYNGSAIDAVYATDCGGVTGEGSEPYLKPVHDKACATAPPWTYSVPLKLVSEALKSLGVEVKNPMSLRVTDVDHSGRVIRAVLSGKDNSVMATGEQLRKYLGYDRLRSTLFEVKTDQIGNCVFTGRGWGHGLGMCQNGAVNMAKFNHATYNQIIQHYYDGVEITDLTSDFLQQDSDVTRDSIATGSTNSFSFSPTKSTPHAL